MVLTVLPPVINTETQLTQRSSPCPNWVYGIRAATMMDLLIHLFVLTPVVNKIFSNKEYTMKEKYMYSFGFLALCASYSVYDHWSQQPQSLYSIMDLPVVATNAEIKKQYRTMSIHLHPDKNPQNPLAEKQFIAMKMAHDILSNKIHKDAYDKFGPEALRAIADNKDPYSGALMGSAMFYVMWVVITYLLCGGDNNAAGRTWTYTFMAVLFITEFQAKFGDFSLLIPMLPKIAPFQVLDMLKHLLPTVMSSSRIVSQANFTDESSALKELQVATFQATQQILALLIVLEESLNKGKAATAVAAGVAPMMTQQQQANLAKAQEIVGTLRQAPGHKPLHAKKPQEEGGGGGGINWTGMMFPIFLAWFFSRT